MKNIINYFYNLYPENIYQNKKEYYFYIDKIKYSLIKTKETYNIDLSPLKNLYIHSIILNKDSSLVTSINNQQYILLQKIKEKKSITLEDIIPFTNIPAQRKDIDWGKLWSKKNDYLEFQISKLGTNYKIIRDSFSYFIGLGETAISIYNSIAKPIAPTFYAHKRVDDIYNPLNIIIDYKVRDIAEYFKQKHYKGNNIESELYNYIKTTPLTYNEYMLLLSRLLYPTPYYDLFEEIITGREEENEIKKIIDKSQEFEFIIKKLYQYYKSFMNLVPIEWLE